MTKHGVQAILQPGTSGVFLAAVFLAEFGERGRMNVNALVLSIKLI